MARGVEYGVTPLSIKGESKDELLLREVMEQNPGVAEVYKALEAKREEYVGALQEADYLEAAVQRAKDDTGSWKDRALLKLVPEPVAMIMDGFMKLMVPQHMRGSRDSYMGAKEAVKEMGIDEKEARKNRAAAQVYEKELQVLSARFQAELQKTGRMREIVEAANHLE